MAAKFKCTCGEGNLPGLAHCEGCPFRCTCGAPESGLCEGCRRVADINANIDQVEFVKRIRTQADWIEAWDASLIDQLTVCDLDLAVRQFMANVERALRDARRRKAAA